MGVSHLDSLAPDSKDSTSEGSSNETPDGTSKDSQECDIRANTGSLMLDAKDLHMVDREYYDLSTFQHPGGDLMIEQSKGDDITVSVKSHHFSDQPYRVMKKYKVEPSRVRGEIEHTSMYTFKEDGFFDTCKRRVVEVLGQESLRAGVDTQYKVKVAFSIAVWVVTWLYCCFRPFWFPAVVACSLIRLVLTGIGHEGVHGRLRNPFKYLMDLTILFPADSWHFEHSLRHHPHTKRYDIDPDEIFPFVARFNERTPWQQCHCVQVVFHLLFGIIMGVGSAGDHVFGKGAVRWTLFVKFSLILLLTQFLPLFTHPDGVYVGLAVHLLVVAMSNCITLNTFRLSHITEKTSSKHYDATAVDGVDWGEHQLRTTCNFRTMLMSVSGMLDMQIEHHLFPSLTYAQQDQIRDVVKSTAKEFDIPYHEFSGLFHGFFCHMGHLNHLAWSPESESNQKSHVE